MLSIPAAIFPPYPSARRSTRGDASSVTSGVQRALESWRTVPPLGTRAHQQSSAPGAVICLPPRSRPGRASGGRASSERPAPNSSLRMWRRTECWSFRSEAPLRSRSLPVNREGSERGAGGGQGAIHSRRHPASSAALRAAPLGCLCVRGPAVDTVESEESSSSETT